MDVFNWAFVVFTVAGLLAMGGYMLFFNRPFSVKALRQRQAIWRMGYSEFDIRIMRVLSAVVGAGLLVGGVLLVAQLVAS